MKARLFLVLLLLPYTDLFANPSGEELRLMTQIAQTLRSIEDIDFSAKRERIIHRRWRSYEQKRQWIKRDMAALLKLNPLAARSSHRIWSQPFTAHIAKGKKLMKLNNTKHKAYLASKAAEPNPEAVSRMDLAIKAAALGGRMMKNGKRGYKRLLRQHQGFERLKSEALKLDPRVEELRKNEIAKVRANFLSPFGILKKKEEARVAKIKAEKLAALKKRQEEARRQKEALAKHRVERAKNAGFKSGPYLGLWNFVNALGSGNFDKKAARKFLIFQSTQDTYEVQNVDGNFVFFIDLEDKNFSQIAIIKEEGKVYLEGHALPEGEYAFINIGLFVTSSRVEIQVPIFRRLK